MDSTMTVDAPFKAGAAEQLRFESFKLGWADSAPSLPPSRPHSMRRSHSRGGSISSSISSLSLPTSTATISPDFASSSSTGSVPSKRNSHHRRRSSVSTRHESAEIMGFSLPELPAGSFAEEAGDKDSSRQSALWALEGKHDASVEIPSTPDMEKMMLSFPSKPSFPAGSAFGSNGLSSMITSKRDSFKLAPKDQLHTLVEEEEEEEDSHAAATAPVASPPTPITPSSHEISFTSPATTHTKRSLRPLSLTPESVGFISHILPASTATSAYKHSSLSSSITSEEEIKLTNFYGNDNFARKTLTNEASPTPRRPPLELKILSSPNLQDDKAGRRSSISYRRSSGHGLPTPDATPTTHSHWRHSLTTSTSSGAGSISSAPEGPLVAPEDSEFFVNGGTRRMSASEQHFLWKSHNALLSRIQDLERTQAFKRRDSLMSSTSSDASDDASRQINELTAEREELKRDVEGWRIRVGDLEKQIGMVMRRVDEERKDAWLAREKVGAAQAEKTFLERQLADRETVVTDLKHVVGVLQDAAAIAHSKQDALSGENAKLLQRNRELEVEIEILRSTSLASVDDHAPTPTATSFEPAYARQAFAAAIASSDADFDPFGDNEHNFTLSAVDVEDDQEHDYSQSTPEDESICFDEEEDDGLTGYEDEEEDDCLCQSPSESTGSFGSPEIPFSISRAQPSVPVAPVSQPFTFQPKHQVRGSLSKTWAWPTKASTPLPKARTQSISDSDKFFACLNESANEESLPLPSRYNFEDGKTLFCQGLQAYADDEDDFYSPSEKSHRELLNVAEEDEEDDDDTEGEETQVDDEDMFGDVGGIKITFTPADEEESMDFGADAFTSEKTVEATPTPPMYFDDSDSDEDFGASVPFNFGRQIAVQSPPVTARSNIPRPVTIYRTPSLESMTSDASSAAPDSPLYSTRPSFIPQRSASPASAPSFMRQPPRKAASVPKASENPISSVGKGTFSHSQPGEPKMVSIDLSTPQQTPASLPVDPNASPSLFGAASKLSFQSFTNLISTPWATTTTRKEHSTPAIPCYVSKETQLEKLRQRLVREQERLAPTPDFRTQCHHPSEVVEL